MKMSTYLGILALGILIASLAHADQPGSGYPPPQQQQQPYPQQEQQPDPIEQFPPDQQQPNYCPAPCRPRVRAVPGARSLAGVCVRTTEDGVIFHIMLNGRHLVSGYQQQVEKYLMHYVNTGYCRAIWRMR